MGDLSTGRRQVPSGAGEPRPYREALRVTLLRTLTVAFFITCGLTLVLPHRSSHLRFWATTYPAVLWFPLGGHYVELAYLNFLRIRWPVFRGRRPLGRVVWWFGGGLPLGLGCWWTWLALGNRPDFRPPFWWGMPVFVVVEFVVHGVLSLRGRPSFWKGRQ